jgi:hypothetical protein
MGFNLFWTAALLTDAYFPLSQGNLPEGLFFSNSPDKFVPTVAAKSHTWHRQRLIGEGI